MPKKRSGLKGRNPAHQNSFAFKHNKGSKKTEAIYKVVHKNLCSRCYDKVEWRKKYRKYKPLTKSRKCNRCHQPKVNRAYHTLCDDCSVQDNVCAWCATDRSEVRIVKGRNERAAARKTAEAELESSLALVSERQRRTLLRKKENGTLEMNDIIRAVGGEAGLDSAALAAAFVEEQADAANGKDADGDAAMAMNS